MARLKPSERIWVERLSADRMRRSLISRVLYLPPFRWHFDGRAADQLLIVPQDLRTADPSFWDEYRLGQMGLAGTVALVDEAGPFEIDPPSLAWAKALHGFEWLRHLHAAGSPEAREAARALVLAWAAAERGGTGIAWQPAVLGRRLISWITHSSLLLDGAEPRAYDAIVDSLAMQLVRLAATWRSSPGGYPRLVALNALVLAGLCIAGHEQNLADAESAFSGEIDRQILSDGGHISRNPDVLVELMLDFLPLNQCFAARTRPAPAQLTAAMKSMLAMLRFMRMGDGRIGRFNGVSVAAPAGLATVLAYDDAAAARAGLAPASRYARLERGATIVIVDAGPVPPMEAAGDAHAGCLSFEMSVGAALMFVNGGAPGPANAEWRAVSRATASHSTLCLGEKSSSKLVRHRRLEELVGAPPIRFPDRVHADIDEQAGGLELVGEHNGYVRRFGLLHRRSLALHASGRRLVGVDRIDSEGGNVRLKQDLPFSAHFHLHPSAEARLTGTNRAEIVLADGAVWSFALEGASLAIEDSTFFADNAGPRRTLQIVARGASFGQTEIRWVVEAARSADAAQALALPPGKGGSGSGEKGGAA